MGEMAQMMGLGDQIAYVIAFSVKNVVVKFFVSEMGEVRGNRLTKEVMQGLANKVVDKVATGVP